MNIEEEEKVRKILSSFSCEKDSDIEAFIREKAVTFEKLAKARTYLIVNQDQLINSDPSQGDLVIYGYISLALKVLTLPDNMSGNQRKKLDGLSSKVHGKFITDIPCYLIGQLARNSGVSKDTVTGKDLIEYALSIISAAVDAVGGRIMMIECRNNDSLISFYRENGFEIISKLSDNNMPMIQMIRRIEESELLY